MPVQILNYSDKLFVLELHEDGWSNQRIADWFEVSEKTIRRILKEMKQKEQDVYDAYTDDELDNFPEYMYVATSNVISVTRLFDNERVVFQKDHPRFEDAKILIETLDSEDIGYNNEVLKDVFDLGSLKAQLEVYEKDGIIIDRDEGKLKYRDEQGVETEFHGRLVERVVKALEKKGDLSKKFISLVAFAKRLSKNPSHRAVNELFDFLEASDIKILADGKVRCFKKVRSTFKDIHSNTMDNSVGTTVSVPRNQVDEDSDTTCSYGLHVCSKSYLPHFGSAGEDVILEVHVDPADFVAIPRDYNNAKARVCSYYVAGVVDYNDI